MPTSPIHLEYTMKMRGVDVNDQLRASYTTFTRSKKWWHRIFMFLLDVAITNLWILHKYLCVALEKKAMTHLEFMMGLAFSLIKKWGSSRQGVVSIYNSSLGTHTLDKVKGGRHICRYCKSKTKLTNLVCRDCGSIWFQLGECHRKSHFPQRKSQTSICTCM